MRSTSITDDIVTPRTTSTAAPRATSKVARAETGAHSPARVRSETRPLTVATVLTPIERVRVDVAAQGMFDAVHRASMDELAADVREQRVDAVIVSVARYDPQSSARMADVVREFPRVPAFALLTDVQRSTPQSALELGRIGVRTIVDARSPAGWTTLRELLARERSSDVQRQTLGALDDDLAGAPSDCWRFFELLFTHRPYVSNVRQMGRHMNVVPGTLMSRFYRAKLPSPKRYIDVGRLVRAARLLENPGLSITTVSRQLDYSSPQAFSRHVRCVLGMSPVDFRSTYTGESMLERFRKELIAPHVETLRQFRPATAPPGWYPRVHGAESRYVR